MPRVRPVAAALAALPLLLALGHALPGATAAARPSLVPSPAISATARVTLPAGRASVRPGEAATVTGALRDRSGNPVAATFTLRVSDPNGRVLGDVGPLGSAPDGTFAAVVPGRLTALAHPSRVSKNVVTLAARVVDVRAGRTRVADAGAAPITVAAAPSGLELTNDFTSSRGWVKPGDTYPFRVLVRNYASAAVSGAVVTLPAVEGMRFTNQRSADPDDTVTVAGGDITWAIDAVPGATDPALPGTSTLIVEGRADNTSENPRIVWHDLSTTATLHAAAVTTSKSHGPKVIPPDDLYNTARFGDRPFPVVPVDFLERKHKPEHSGATLADKINSPAVAGSTFNLYQELSYKQLYPHATVPSAGIATAGFPKQFTFTQPKPNGACTPDGLVNVGAGVYQNTPAYPERIKDGWYQLPGTTQYYGLDRFGPQSALAGAVSGQALLFDIDSACGPTAKGVYDAAAIADPEVDYSDFDTDKDGVVDFFMMVFVGLGGHGASVAEGYDNIWPHSSSLEFTYVDPVTKQGGYVTDDQLKDLEGRPLWYTDAARVTMTTTPGPDNLKVFVRVGPYNVNPESAIDKASVISHEYGHSLGLPDFYSTGSRATYGDWNLMATDKSQNMDVFSKQDMGWIVPRVIPAGTSKVTGWKDSKVNTHRIDWKTPGGTPYTLSGPDVANGEAYTAKLPGKQLISPEKVSQGASPSHVWWSGSGNNYGCSPEGGHNLDIGLPELQDVPAGAKVTLSFASYWDMEWDYDYGFVLISKDKGQTYTSVASANSYTTPAAQNPNTNNCQAKYGNGITGTSGSYKNGTAPVDRVAAAPGSSNYPDGPFLPDSYDISALAGSSGVVRFSYATDPGLAHPGWFIDDVVISVDGKPIWKTNFEDASADRPRLYNGGCKEDLRVAARCTKGWQWVSSDVAATADHGYYLEMRDRSGFDFNGKNENDRAAIGFAPGLLNVYTNEAHGYGNAGTDDPPAQSPLDAKPQVGNASPNLNDAAFTKGDSFNDSGWVDNYKDPTSESGNWEFRHNCLKFTVNDMTGDDPGPDSAPGVGGDLVGDVTFTTTPRCAAFNYGYSGAASPNVAPTAVLEVKPATARVGQPVSFDGSGSSDDRDAPPDLAYAWTFGDGATGSGRAVSHAYAKAGTYDVTLKVTDKNGASSARSSKVTVTNAPAGKPPTSLPSTGANDAFALLAIGGMAMAVLLRRRARRHS
jgi:M6 family metalloprotease-like protein